MKRRIIYGLGQEYFLAQFNEDQIHERVRNDELENDLFQADALDSVRARFKTFPYVMMNDVYTNLYRDLEGYFSDGQKEIFLDLNPLWDTPPEWWRDSVFSDGRVGKSIRLREENRERLRVIISIHRAFYPEDALLWGVCPANNNEVE